LASRGPLRRRSGTRVYVLTHTPSTVFVLDATRDPIEQIASLPLTGSPRDLVIGPTDTELWITNPANGTVDLVDVSGPAPTLVQSISLGGMPGGIDILPSGAKIYVGDLDSGRVWAVDTTTFLSTEIALLPDEDAQGVRVNPDGTRVYVATNRLIGRLATIDTASDTILGVNDIATGVPLHAVTVTPDGAYVIAATHEGNGIWVFDASVDPAALIFGQGVSNIPGRPLSSNFVGLAANPAIRALHTVSTELVENSTFYESAMSSHTIEDDIGFPAARYVTLGIRDTSRDVLAPVGIGKFIGPELPGTGVEAGSGICTFSIDDPVNFTGSIEYEVGMYNVFGATVILPLSGTFSGTYSNATASSVEVDATGSLDFSGTLSCFEPYGCPPGVPSQNPFYVGALLEADMDVVNPIFPPGTKFRISGALKGFSLPIFGGSLSGPCAIQAYLGETTPPGSNVTVSTHSSIVCGEPVNVPVSVTYDDVSATGTTLVTTSCSGAAAPGYSVDLGYGYRFFFDVSTTATHSGPIEICIGYPGFFSPEEAPALVLLHDSGSGLLPISSMVDTVARTICATVTSLSPFAVAVPVPDEAGFVPPDADAGKCTGKVSKALSGLAKALIKCHRKAASSALSAKEFDRAACEAGAKAKYDQKVASLSGCPGCTTANLVALRDGAAAFHAALNGDVYCQQGLPLGTDLGGFVPPNKASNKCEGGVAKALSKFTAAEISCHQEAADAALAGDPITLADCETDARAGYDDKVRKLKNCSACTLLNAAGIRAQVERHYDVANGDLYCAGVTPFP
jgi:hypothetical protein